MSTHEITLKSLIHKTFSRNSTILWITLLIACRRPRRGLENKGLCWIAHKRSKFKNPYESTTYKRYWICSRALANGLRLLHRNNIFVHKSGFTNRFQSQIVLGRDLS